MIQVQKTTHALALRAASHIVEHISGAPDMQCLSESQLFRIALTTAKRLSNSDQQAQHETLPDCCRIIDALALQRASVSDLLEHEDTLARETAEVLGDLVVRSRAAASSINAQTAASSGYTKALVCLFADEIRCRPRRPHLPSEDTCDAQQCFDHAVSCRSSIATSSRPHLDANYPSNETRNASSEGQRERRRRICNELRSAVSLHRHTGELA